MNDRVFNIKRRSASRLAAVQALYEMDMMDTPADAVLQEFLEHRWSNASPVDTDDDSDLFKDIDPKSIPGVEPRFLKRLVRGVTGTKDKLDSALAPHLSSPWTIESLEALVRTILRTAAYELLECPEIATRTILTEYIGLAHAFFTEKEPTMINAVLDAVARAHRTEEAPTPTADTA